VLETNLGVTTQSRNTMVVVIHAETMYYCKKDKKDDNLVPGPE
jgi:hypothetical protein